MLPTIVQFAGPDLVRLHLCQGPIVATLPLAHFHSWLPTIGVVSDEFQLRPHCE
jgi:hypothetical protein